MASSPEQSAVLKKWREETDPIRREELFDDLVRSGVFPQDVINQWEVGLYPAYDDEEFIPKLMRKREIQDAKHEPIDMEKDACRSTEGFELTPTQRFISTLLSPRTPYNGLLLYHGVGVGKTCAAVTACESYLELSPKRHAYIVAPRLIQEGFIRTIFDLSSLVIGSGAEPNRHNGCTGDLYLMLTGTLFERERSTIERLVKILINKRYKFFGYYAFYKEIVRVKGTITGSDDRKLEELRRVFSNRILVVDEAHNLRDIPDEKAEDAADDISVGDTQDSSEGKKLSPFLKEVLRESEGITLLLMTATPMYNSYKEIIFLLNLLLINDKRTEIRFPDIFVQTAGGNFEFTATGERALGAIASTTVSFMRGENPSTFPIRLEPQTAQRITVWPTKTPKGAAIESGREVSRLPCVGCYFSAESEAFYKQASADVVGGAEGLSITAMDRLIQGGNWLFPVEDAEYADRIQQIGFDATFIREPKGTTVQFRDVDESRHSSWLLDTALPAVSGKASYLLKRLAKTKGVAFVYSRFVATGALTLALCLEANGYTAWSPEGRGGALLADGIQHPEGRQCALCPAHEKGHRAEDHTFTPAKYILLTGMVELTPNSKVMIDAVRSSRNMDGSQVKVVLGSQIAGEGLDLRYIRELFVFDSWYHLNKLEQVIGRGVRNCSHAGLDVAKRNTTITLLVNSYASQPTLETVDQYSYRTALLKANVIGKVSRVLKEYAMDCSLTHDVVVLERLGKVTLIDGQGVPRKDVDVNDVPFTALCDWLGRCSFDCKADGRLEGPIDYGTYDDYTLRYKEKQVRKMIEDLVVRQDQVSITIPQLEGSLQNIPSALLKTLIQDILSKEFIIQTRAGPGRILMKNQRLIFQPEVFRGLAIPTAVRMLEIPVTRDAALYEPAASTALAAAEPVSEVEEKDSESLWEAVNVWAESVRKGTAASAPATIISVPSDVIAELSSIGSSSVHIDGLKERLGTFVWLYASVKESAESRETLASVLLDFVWDEVLTQATREALLTAKSGESLREITPDSFLDRDGNVYIRLYNTEDGGIKYFTRTEAGAVPMKLAVRELLIRESKFPTVDTTTTGVRYGFLVQRGPNDMIFKVTTSLEVGKKVGRGSACASSSATRNEVTELIRLGTLLRSAGKSDLGLNEDELNGRRRLQNANRICTLSNMVLRFMDRSAFQGKRWFYRALEAKLTGHRNL